MRCVGSGFIWKMTRASTQLSLVAWMVKTLSAIQETQVRSLCWEDPLQKGMATHSSILAWRIPWTEEHCGLWSIGFQRVGHSWSDWACMHTWSKSIIFTFGEKSRFLKRTVFCLRDSMWHTQCYCLWTQLELIIRPLLPAEAQTMVNFGSAMSIHAFQSTRKILNMRH